MLLPGGFAIPPGSARTDPHCSTEQPWGEWQMQSAAKGLNKDSSVQRCNSGKKGKPTSYGRCQCRISFFMNIWIFF